MADLLAEIKTALADWPRVHFGVQKAHEWLEFLAADLACRAAHVEQLKADLESCGRMRAYGVDFNEHLQAENVAVCRQRDALREQRDNLLAQRAEILGHTHSERPGGEEGERQRKNELNIKHFGIPLYPEDQKEAP